MARLPRIPPRVRVSFRAGFCLLLPLLVGIASGEKVIATLVSLGALWVISQDGIDRWVDRSRRLVGVAVCAGGGFLVGTGAHEWLHSYWSLWAFYGVMSLLAGFVETTSRPAPGMYLLLGAVVGSAFFDPNMSWQPGFYILAGGLLVCAVAMVTDRRSRALDQRLCVANAYGALVRLLRRVNESSSEDVRVAALTALDVAQDALTSAHRAVVDDETAALHDCFVIALQLGELSSVLRGRSHAVDRLILEALGDVARTLRSKNATDARDLLRDLREAIENNTDVADRDLFLNALSPSFHTMTMVPVLASPKERLPLYDRLRFGALLAFAVVAGAMVSYELDSPHAYWLPLSVGFILRPDLGPVITRAVARTVGTMAGVGIAALVSLSGNNTVALLILCTTMAAITPWASRRSHALTVLAFTPIVFTFLAVIGPDQSLFLPRIEDTALAAGIVLLIDVVLWSKAPSLRPERLVAYASYLTQRYETSDTSSDPQRRHQQRRNALRAVARARSAIRQTQAEPHPLRHPDASLTEQLEAITQRIDARTAHVVEMHS